MIHVVTLQLGYLVRSRGIYLMDDCVILCFLSKLWVITQYPVTSMSWTVEQAAVICNQALREVTCMTSPQNVAPRERLCGLKDKTKWSHVNIYRSHRSLKAIQFSTATVCFESTAVDPYAARLLYKNAWPWNICTFKEVTGRAVPNGWCFKSFHFVFRVVVCASCLEEVVWMQNKQERNLSSLLSKTLNSHPECHFSPSQF